MGKALDLTNKRFGKLTAKRNLGKPDGRRYVWECQCDCGNTCIVQTSRLTSGNTKSCGCGKYDGFKKHNKEASEKAKIEIGTRFGKLTVSEDMGIQDGRRIYKCICDCGNEHLVKANNLKTGATISCGQCNLRSKGEYLISQILDTNNLSYDYDKVFNELKKETNRSLRFDFIVYEDDEKTQVKYFIEFDGRQHKYGPDTKYWSRNQDTLEDIQERDKIKNDFCISKGYKLYRIPYYIKITDLQSIINDKFLIKE